VIYNLYRHIYMITDYIILSCAFDSLSPFFKVFSAESLWALLF
jgi:hypothetical protein